VKNEKEAAPDQQPFLAGCHWRKRAEPVQRELPPSRPARAAELLRVVDRALPCRVGLCSVRGAQCTPQNQHSDGEAKQHCSDGVVDRHSALVIARRGLVAGAVHRCASLTLHNAQSPDAGWTCGGMGPQGPMAARRHAGGHSSYPRAAGGRQRAGKGPSRATGPGRGLPCMQASTGGSRLQVKGPSRATSVTIERGAAGARGAAVRRRHGAPALWACLFTTSETRKARNEQRRGSPAGSARGRAGGCRP